MVVKLLAAAVLLTVVGSSSPATDPTFGQTTWNNTTFSIKIPKHFPVDIPIVTLSLLSSPASPDPAKVNNQFGIDGTLAELRLPNDVDARAAMDDWGEGGGGGGMGPISGGMTMDPSRGLKPPQRMVLLTNPKNLFHSHVQVSPNRISLRLQRPVNFTDYVRHSSEYGRIEVMIGPNGTQLDEKGLPERRDNVITIQVIILNEFKCDRPRKNACMFPEGPLELRQWENRPTHALVTLPPLSVLCPSLQVEYSLTTKDTDNGEMLLTTDRDRLSIRPIRSLDRERHDKIKFMLTCKIPYARGDIIQHREGTLVVLDEDDSPPFRTKNLVVEWHHTNNTDDLDDQLMIVDPDLRSTNTYKVELIGNTYNLVILESVNKWSIRKDLCASEAENVTGYTFAAECTLLTPGFKMKTDEKGKLDLTECRDQLASLCNQVLNLDSSKIKKKVPPKIKFSVAFIDKSLILSDPQASRQVAYDIILTLPHCEEDAEEVGAISYPHTDNGPGSASQSDSGAEWSRIEQENPPVEFNVTVPRPVNKYFRLGQLIHPSVTRGDHRNMNPPNNVAFYVAPETSDMGVDVTPVNGIIYVRNPNAVKEGELIVRRGDTSISVLITVNDIELAEPCPVLDPLEDMGWCSSKEYNTTCMTSCGMGAASYCSWRPYVKDNPGPESYHYATCSPDFGTCPDGVCDDLENRFMGLCPQDCVDESDIEKSKYVRPGQDGRGIKVGWGVCSCNERDGNCLCYPAGEDPPPLNGHDAIDVVQKKPRVPRRGCDRSCQIGVATTGILSIFIGVIAVLYCRRRAMRGGKPKGGVFSLGALPNDDRGSSLAYTRDEPHDTVYHGIRSSPRTEHNFVPSINVTQIDQKWEFPRGRLVIEQTLGEGEFGKVMRAKAQGINGTLGYTTVAVKMLKSNSTPAELNDLLSEYSLLKEVCHPNVVKLLGACTIKGGPIYIIIEYCQYGSLRNYLKRSRHVEFENRVGSGPAEGTAADYNVTPKDILSFAWQISKGMAYLTDMKLVHRDLAARNVLLAASKVCKISDFGLTRDVYEGDLYFKRSKGRVPVKWMALESLVDHVYTSKSDVWGFGVLLWELVTLGTLPYPGVQPERLFTLLKDGYRMEKPDNCSLDLYDVMLQCWAESPARRPCFQELKEIFEGMIQADVEYLELRSLIVTNRSYFDSVPEPPQQFQDAPPQIQIAAEPLHEIPPQFQDRSENSPDSSSPQMEDSQNPELDWSPPAGRTDADAYLVARTDVRRPCREESTEPLLAPTPTAGLTPMITTSHAHNPAYSPTSEILPPPLHYSTLASRPDEEDAHTLECCRSEEDSDSGRATGDSGYATEEGRGRWKGDHKGSCRAPITSPRGSSYSPLPRHSQDPDDDHDPEDDQDTSEDLEERQELLNEDLLGHLTPSPEPAHAAHNTRTAHTSHAAHNAHTTPVIV